RTAVANTILDSFVFQAEDGIRDSSVTGVQTCALPIFAITASMIKVAIISLLGWPTRIHVEIAVMATIAAIAFRTMAYQPVIPTQIGRASCRERVKKQDVAECEEKQYMMVLRAGL